MTNYIAITVLAANFVAAAFFWFKEIIPKTTVIEVNNYLKPFSNNYIDISARCSIAMFIKQRSIIFRKFEFL